MKSVGKKDYKMEQFELLLSGGTDLQIDPDQDYKFNWDVDAETHQALMHILRVILEDEYSNFVVGDAIIFYDQLKNVVPVNHRVKREVECSGLSITALSIILYEIWKEEDLDINKEKLGNFINGMYRRISPVEKARDKYF